MGILPHGVDVGSVFRVGRWDSQESPTAFEVLGLGSVGKEAEMAYAHEGGRRQLSNREQAGLEAMPLT